jgi:hypothetical protein
METKNLNSLYEEANALEYITNFELNAMELKSKLDHLHQAYDLQIKIGNISVYKIGEILTLIKKTCLENNIGFEKWIDENLKICHKTAVNYMHVFTYCLSRPEIAEKIPPAILYKVCIPSFSEEFRESLFSSGILEDISNIQFQNLVEKAKKEGPEAIEKAVEEINRGRLIYNQLSYTLDMAGNALRMLKNFKEQIEHRGNIINNGIVDFKEQIKSDQPEASEINLKLYEAVETAISTINTALLESRERLNEYNDKITDKM